MSNPPGNCTFGTIRRIVQQETRSLIPKNKVFSVHTQKRKAEPWRYYFPKSLPSVIFDVLKLSTLFFLSWNFGMLATIVSFR